MIYLGCKCNWNISAVYGVGTAQELNEVFVIESIVYVIVVLMGILVLYLPVGICDSRI